jgi:hypothetical protein
LPPWPFPEAPPVVPLPPPVATYSTLATLLMSKVAAGELTVEQIDAACLKYGVPSFPALGNRPDLVPVVMKELGL